MAARSDNTEGRNRWRDALHNEEVLFAQPRPTAPQKTFAKRPIFRVRLPVVGGLSGVLMQCSPRLRFSA